MSFKLALLFVVCFLALAGAIPVEKTEEDTKQPQPAAAEPEKEAPEEDPVPEENEDADDGEDQSQEENEEEKDDEEEPEAADDNEEEPENEVETKEEDENDEVKRGVRRYHPRCKWVRRRVRRCNKMRCTGSYYRGRGRCCRKYCGYYWIRRRICQICRRKCRLICSYRYRKACQPHRVCVKRRRRHGRYYQYHLVCRYVTRCRRIRYHSCRRKCYGYRCYWHG